MNALSSLTVLIVDDSPTVRYHITKILRNQECSLIEAADGMQAIEKVKEYCPDIVLMDVQMPDMDGIECTRRIKSNPISKNTRIIMVTGEEGYEKKSAAYAVGCYEYINKPVNATQLITSIEKVARFIRTSNSVKTALRFVKSSSSMTKTAS